MAHDPPVLRVVHNQGSAGGLAKFDIFGNMDFHHTFVPGNENPMPGMIHCIEFCFLFLFRLRSGPFEGPAIVKPPALPGDIYCRRFGRALPG
jgi:hypothetical protein